MSASVTTEPRRLARATGPSRRPGGWVPALLLVGTCTALAAVSFVVPAALGYDPAAWLIWGREVGRLDLDTVGGPSWKPLPVVVTAVIAPLGDAAPFIWQLLVRTSALLLIVAVYRIAARAAGPVAGLLAGGFVLLTPDPDPRLLRTALEGHEAPLSTALALWAFDRHTNGHPRTALALGTATALLRPEAWPFLIAYAAWLAWTRPQWRVLVIVMVGLVPLLWFGGDGWGSGNGWHGANVAQVATGTAWERFEDAIVNALEAVPIPVWALAAIGLAVAVRRRQLELLVLSGAAFVWSGIVVAMAVFLRYAALGRFYLPTAAVACVLAGIGAVRAVTAPAGAPLRVATATVVLVVSAPLLLPRIAGLADVVDEVRTRAQLDDSIQDALDAAGGDAVGERCDVIVLEGVPLLQPALAWKADVPVRRVWGAAPLDRSYAIFVVPGGAEDRRIRALPSTERTELARTDAWVVHAVGCAAGR